MTSPKAIQVARTFSTYAGQPWRPIQDRDIYGAQSEDLCHTVTYNPRTGRWTWTMGDEYVTVPCDSIEAMAQDVLGRIKTREAQIQSEVTRHQARIQAERSRLAAQQRRKARPPNRWDNHNRHYR